MKYQYKPSGVCAELIEFEIEDGIVRDICFTRGCNGNGQGVASLAEGMRVEELIARLEHIKCGMRDSSCPAQLAKALKEFV